MQDNKKKLPLIVGILLLVIGVSFAYYTGKLLFGGAGANVNGVTTVIKGTTVTVEGNLSFNDQNILPGHQNVSSIKVSADGSNELLPFSIIWNGINEFGTPLNYTVYKSNDNIEVTATCEQVRGTMNGQTIYSEECNISNKDLLGNVIASGTINQSTEETEVMIKADEFINSGETIYYYVVLEYPNLDIPQNGDIGGIFSGEVTIKDSKAVPDVTFAVYLADENGDYKKANGTPTTGYKLNTTKSVCSKGATPKYVNGSVVISNLTTDTTNCTLYFDIKPYTCKGSACETIMANINTISERTNFSTTYEETTTGTIFSAEDDDGITYYYAGAPTDNWVKFGGYYWRIIRVNGDGTIRLIYAGETAIIDALDNKLEIMSNGYNDLSTNYTQIQKSPFNSLRDDNMYVGFMYESGNVHGIQESSMIKQVLDDWYLQNLFKLSAYIDINAGFCGDRTNSIVEGEAPKNTGGTGTTMTFYGTHYRLFTNKTPSLKCSDKTNDLYTIASSTQGNKALSNPLSLIIADEVAYAGGVYNIENKKYYLYTGQTYWTLSPRVFTGITGGVWNVYDNGYLLSNSVDGHFGVRPVINLRADTIFKAGGKGTSTEPYIVNGAE